MLHEGALQRIELVAVRQALDGADLFAVRLYREHQARAHRLAVDEHRAGAADAVLAADMRAGLTAILANRVGQRAARLDANGVGCPLIVRVISLRSAHACLLSRLAQRRADALRRCRYFVDLTPNGAQRIIDGIENCRRRADGAAFAEALWPG